MRFSTPLPTLQNLTILSPPNKHFNQVLPVALRALLGAEQVHHEDVKASGLPVSTLVGDDRFVDEESAVTGLHRLLDATDDLDAQPIGPVMEDRVHVVRPSPCVCIKSVKPIFFFFSFLWDALVYKSGRHEAFGQNSPLIGFSV